jgi:ribbon-helix-helix CopG family protein
LGLILRGLPRHFDKILSTPGSSYGHNKSIAVTVNKVTYSLKPETVDRVEELAVKWGIPKSEVIRRAIAQVSREERFIPKLTPLQALNELQTFAGITQEQAEKFNREVRSSRRASSRKRG